MKQCPQCSRTYAEDFAYCLEDGARLIDPRSLQATVVLPEPQPTVPSVSPAPAPAPAPGSNKSLVAVILGVLGTGLIVLIWGGIKFGIWYLDHNQNSNQNSNYNPSIASASPSPAYNPLSLLGSPSPTTTPSVDFIASPSPAEGKEGFVGPGTYDWDGTRTFEQQKATLRIRVEIYANGTYYQKVFLTIPEKAIDKLLAMEEKGRFTQSGEFLLLSDRRSREIDFTNGEWQPWRTPNDGSTSRERIRNVTENSFELYDSSERAWFIFLRVINLGTID